MSVGNLTNIVYPLSSSITLKYDAMSRLTNMLDGIGTTKYAYPSAGQLASEDGPWTDDTVSYAYVNRLRASLSLQQPNASPWVQTYAWDSTKRLTGITSPAGTFNYDYDGAHHLMVSTIGLPNGPYIYNEYDDQGRLASTELDLPGWDAMNRHAYTYNTANQRTQQATFTAGTVDYTYDKIGQLKTAKGSDPYSVPRLHEQFGYAYDAAGNLNWRTNNALLQNFQVNSLNELTIQTNSGTLTVAGTTTSEASSVTVSGTGLSSGAAELYEDATWARGGANWVNGANSYTATASDSLGRSSSDSVSVTLLVTNLFAYDQNGNLRTNGVQVLEYDDENQLISVTVSNSWRSEFSYDGKMRRRIRKEFTWSSGWLLTNEVRYVYDGNLVLQERSSPQPSTFDPRPSVSYTRGKDLSGSLEGAGGIGGLLARTENSTLNTQNSEAANAFYHCDGNGNITALINSAQQLVAKYLYDPFGNILSISGPLAEANLYRFSSKEIHLASAIYYYGYRFYEPSLQRWIDRDPLGDIAQLEKAFREHALGENGWQDAFGNLYGFSHNSPPRYIDSDGRLVQAIPAVIGEGVIVGSIAYTLCMAIPSCREALKQLVRELADEICKVKPRPLPRPREETCWIVYESGLICTYACPSGATHTVRAGSGRGCVDTRNFPVP